MPSRRPWLLLGLLPLLLGSGSRFQQAHSPQPVDTSNERYVNDLLGNDASDRLYAARTLRSRLKVALRDAERGNGETLRSIDALAALDDFDVMVAPACVEALERRNVAHHCAEMLGLLGYEPAVPALEAALADPETSRRLRKQAARALEAMPPAEL